ncbi:uncharacterized protein LOC144129527 [Amblyomma americanum]
MSRRMRSKTKRSLKGRKRSLSRDEKASASTVSKPAEEKPPAAADAAVPKSPTSPDSPPSLESPAKDRFLSTTRRGSLLREVVSTLSLYSIHHHTWLRKCIPVLALLAVLLVAGSAVAIWTVFRRRVVGPSLTTPDAGRECEAAQGDPQVHLEALGATVHGSADGRLRKFFGIPYGANVSGAQRFQPAQPVAGIGEGGAFYAYRHGPRCPQARAPCPPFPPGPRTGSWKRSIRRPL